MTEPMIELLDEVWTDVAALCDDLTEAQWKQPHRLPGLVGAGQRRPHDRHRDDAARRGRRRSPTIGHAPHVRNDIGKFNEQWVVLVPQPDRRRDARRLPPRHAAAPRRAARAAGGEVGRGRLHARRSRPVPAVHGDPRLRLLVPRPGHPRGARTGPACSKDRRPTSRSGASRRKGSAVRRRQEGRRTAGRRRSCSTVTGDTPIVATVGVGRSRRALPGGARRTRRRASRWTGGRSRASRAAAGPAIRRARAASLEIAGDVELGQRVVENLAFTL